MGADSDGDDDWDGENVSMEATGRQYQNNNAASHQQQSEQPQEDNEA